MPVASFFPPLNSEEQINLRDFVILLPRYSFVKLPTLTRIGRGSGSLSQDWLWELYRRRYQDLYGISIALIIHSLDPSLSTQLIDEDSLPLLTTSHCFPRFHAKIAFIIEILDRK